MGLVYFLSADGNVYALNATTGATPKLWSFKAVYWGDSSPAVANGVVYVGTQDQHIDALKAATGAELWSFTTGNAVLSCPAVANGMLYVGSGDGNLYAFHLPD